MVGRHGHILPQARCVPTIPVIRLPARVSSRQRATTLQRAASPGYAVMVVGCGHAAWGLIAYRKALAEIAQAGVLDSVGDGIFRSEHADDERAAGFWFMFAAPLMGLTGYLLEAALRAEDARAVKVCGGAVIALGAMGTAVMPRSGFPAVLPVGYWTLRRGRSLLG